MSYPTHVPISFPTKIHQNQTLSYEFRVVEHENDEGKVTAYIMQTQIWAHNPPDHNGNRGNPMLVQDWTDVPRVQMQNGQIVTAPQKKSPPPFSQATVQKLTSNGIGTWAVNPTTFVQDDMEAIVQLLDDDNDKRIMK